VTLLFLQLYPVSSPQFLTNFIALARVYPTSIQSTLPSPAPLNPQTTDLILRLLHEVATEISDAQLRLNKPGASLARDSELRDAVRIRDAAGISAVIWEIIAESLDGLNSPEVPGNKVGLKGQAAKELAEISIRVIGDYVCESNPASLSV
jgi:exportin-T